MCKALCWVSAAEITIPDMKLTLKRRSNETSTQITLIQGHNMIRDERRDTRCSGNQTLSRNQRKTLRWFWSPGESIG